MLPPIGFLGSAWKLKVGDNKVSECFLFFLIQLELKLKWLTQSYTVISQASAHMLCNILTV